MGDKDDRSLPVRAASSRGTTVVFYRKELPEGLTKCSIEDSEKLAVDSREEDAKGYVAGWLR